MSVTELPPYTQVASSDQETPSEAPSARRQSPSSSASIFSSIPLAFWILGLLNNASYVIMLASAKNISEGGTALVFIANIVPSLSVKLSAPYWFDAVGYHYRIVSSSVLMGASFVLVAVASGHVGWELLGVALASLQCGLGEASLLALAGRSDAHSSGSSSKSSCITAFSSGTGLAGVFGFLWKFVWNEWLRLSLPQTLWLATSLAVLYVWVYRRNLWHEEYNESEPLKSDMNANRCEDFAYQTALSAEDEQNQAPDDWQDELDAPPSSSSSSSIVPVEDMTTGQRFRLVLSLYPYTIPLFLVYAAEYSLQAGTWTAIGFPVDSVKARDEFYEYSNWMYQIGVFLSRSSGTLFTAPMVILWLMPVLQCINVVLFWFVAAKHVLYNYWLLIGCLYVGLLGGAVYVNGYTRICADLPLERREFALSSTSVAEGLGIMVADIAGLFLQSCLYKANGITGAVVSCPMR